MGPLILTFCAFLLVPGIITSIFLSGAITLTYLFQISWITASNRWLMKNALEMPVFEIRKYDFLSAALFVCAIISTITILDSNLQLGATASQKTDVFAKGSLLNDDARSFFAFFNFAFLATYVALILISALTLIKSEQKLSHIYNNYFLTLLSYLYLVLTLHFLRKRHKRIQSRLQVSRG